VTASTTLPISAAGGLPRRPSRLHRAILGWYDANGRRLPFRATSDPWAVLVSEVMAQQTQIGRVGPAWERFISRFPTPGALAAATTADEPGSLQDLQGKPCACWRSPLPTRRS